VGALVGANRDPRVTGSRDDPPGGARRGRHLARRRGDAEDARGLALADGDQPRRGEVADAILFLALHASRPMTGSELVIDGGFTAR
jgi:NAD(P)-dependent dehydrogenase (short-subunit alcohol dehydrogenase family)